MKRQHCLVNWLIPDGKQWGSQVVDLKKQLLGPLHHQNSFHAASLAGKTDCLQLQLKP